MGQNGGGFVGSVQNSAITTVNQGYATVGTDTGHQGGGVDASWAYNNLERRVNFGYRTGNPQACGRPPVRSGSSSRDSRAFFDPLHRRYRDAGPALGLPVRPVPAGAGQPNPACASSPQPPADGTENPRSLGTLITFGKLRILDLGDLTADKERELMCPADKIGHVDIYIASHHGFKQSGSAALVHAITPRVAIVDNGATKGGSPSALDIIKSSPNLAALWQLHFSEEAGTAHNTAPEFIANPSGPDAANYLKLTANPDGSFSVFNSRSKQSQQYSASR